MALLTPTNCAQAMVRRSLESDNRALAMRASGMKKQLENVIKERDNQKLELEKWRTGQVRESILLLRRRRATCAFRIVSYRVARECLRESVCVRV